MSFDLFIAAEKKRNGQKRKRNSKSALPFLLNEIQIIKEENNGHF